MREKSHVDLIGFSPAMTELKAEVLRIAASDAKVLITGESGVGKEVVAQAINSAGARAQKPFVPVNCAGIPETLLESELFGHVRGSFTGAYRDKPGKLEMANDGTIFLDEIGEMTLRMQGLLLRFLETGEIQKVGAERMGRATNVRLIAATNRNLRELIAQGQFREDLFYRLNVVSVVLPPLRERRETLGLEIESAIGLHDVDGRERLLERRSAMHDPTARVDREAAAVVDHLVLATDVVQVGDRQLVFPRAGREVCLTLDLLALLEGRGIDGEHDVRTGPACAGNDVGMPDVLADQRGDAQATNLDHDRAAARREVALLVEYSVIRQSLLTISRHECTLAQNAGAVVETFCCCLGVPENNRHASNGVSNPL